MRDAALALTLEQRLPGSTRKGFLRGTHRAVPPEQTLENVRPMLRHVGVTRVANVTGLDNLGIPVVLAVRPNSRSLSVTQGKGLDLPAAKASAIMEAVEQFFAETVALPLRLGSYRQLSAEHSTIDAGSLPGYVRPFDPALRCLWATGTELFTGTPRLVPFDMVHLDLTLPLPPGSGCFPLGSNGLASGNSPEEAIVHGLCELVERDAMALFRALPPEQQHARRLRLDTVEDGACAELLERYRSAGVRVALWDITSDAGLAAFYCAIVEERLDPLHPVGRACGFGCHLDRGVALSRALCEAAQSRLTRISGSRDDIAHTSFQRLRSEAAVVSAQAELEPREAGVRSFREVPSQSFPTFEEDLAWAVARLHSIGIREIVSVDLSPAFCPVSVVRVVAPRLEGASDVPGYVPGPRARANQGAGGP